MSASGDFEQLLNDIEREAHHDRPAAVADLRAMKMRYRLVARLIQRRRELRLTQKELAARSGIGQAEISKIERGRKSPTLDTYSRLATALDLVSEDLVTLLTAVT